MRSRFKKPQNSLRENAWLFFDALRGRVKTFFEKKRMIRGGAQEDPERKRLFIYPHYDPKNRIHPFVMKQLRALKELGGDLVFLTSCPSLPEKDEAEILAMSTWMFYKENFGRDFSGFRMGLLETPNAFKYQQIVTTNDSDYGPFHDLGGVFDKMSRRDLDLWGITDCWAEVYHLQSFFLVFNQRIIKNGFLEEFWRQWPNYCDRWNVIRQGEYGITQAVMKNNFRVGALCEYREVFPRLLHEVRRRIRIAEGKPLGELSESAWEKPSKILHDLSASQANLFLKRLLEADPANQLHAYGNILVESEGCPFLKVDLVRGNPAGIPNFYSCTEWMDPEQLALINDHCGGFGVKSFKKLKTIVPAAQGRAAKIDFLKDYIAGKTAAPFLPQGEVPGLAAPAIAQHKRLFVYAHHDFKNHIRPHMMQHLEALKKLGGDIVLVTSCDKLTAEDLATALPLLTNVIYKKNSGREYTSYQTGILQTPNAFKYEQIILMNASVYGPFRDLENIFERMSQKDLDFWGITDSYEGGHHIQAYFQVFNRKMVSSSFFKNFWISWPGYRDRHRMIREGEIGFSQKAVKQGFKIGALCDYKEVVCKAVEDLRTETWQNSANRPWREAYLTQPQGQRQLWMRHCQVEPYNPQLFFWDTLIEHFGCPFIKVQLLQENPADIPNLAHCEALIGADQMEIITRHTP